MLTVALNTINEQQSIHKVVVRVTQYLANYISHIISNFESPVKCGTPQKHFPAYFQGKNFLYLQII